MESGVAGTIAVEHIIGGEDITEKVNIWLMKNADIEVIDIKFQTNSTDDEWATDVLIIYRKDV